MPVSQLESMRECLRLDQPLSLGRRGHLQSGEYLVPKELGDRRQELGGEREQETGAEMPVASNGQDEVRIEFERLGLSFVAADRFQRTGHRTVTAHYGRLQLSAALYKDLPGLHAAIMPDRKNNQLIIAFLENPTEYTPMQVVKQGESYTLRVCPAFHDLGWDVGSRYGMDWRWNRQGWMVIRQKAGR